MYLVEKKLKNKRGTLVEKSKKRSESKSDRKGHIGRPRQASQNQRLSLPTPEGKTAQD